MHMFRLMPLSLFMVLVTMLPSCEVEQEEIRCIPEKVNRKISAGTMVTEIIMDHKYMDDRLDRINLSNYQTHSFRYNDDGRLATISRKDVKFFRKVESRLTYDGELVVRADEYVMRLDQFTQEDIDTTLQGYRTYTYEGGLPVEEWVYLLNADSKEMALEEVREYTYDEVGNVLQFVSLDDINGDTLEASSFTYDSQHHPYDGLDLLFEGESHVNNILKRTDLMNGDEYVHQIVYSATDYPQQVTIRKNGISNEEITIFSYTCQ